MKTQITDIKTLRNKTGAGFADCKKALEESNNDIEAAIKILKEMGKAAAEKRAGRPTSEGSIFIAEQGNKVAILELSCETDFVARNEDFQKLGHTLSQTALNHGSDTINDIIKEKIQDTIATIKENIELKRMEIVEKSDDELFATYTHGTPAKLASVVVMKTENPDALQSETVKTLAFNCALHVVARLPLFLNTHTIDEQYKNDQLDIIRKQVAQLGKPEKVAEGIIQGKWKKHTSEICLVLQPWVHDEKSTAQDEITKVSKEVGADIQIANFLVFVLGNE